MESLKVDKLADDLRTIILTDSFPDVTNFMEQYNDEEKKQISNTKIGTFTSLHLAAVVSNYEMVKYLIENCYVDIIEDKTGEQTVLDLAVLFGAATKEPRIIQYLISKGADINRRDEEGKTYLMNRITNLTTCEILLENGIDLYAEDQEENTAFHHALFTKSEKALDLLIKYGEKTMIKSQEVAIRILNIGCCMENAKLVRFALRNGADVDINKVDSRDFFRWFVCNPDIISLLISKGIDVLAVDGCQLTSIHHLVKSANFKILLDIHDGNLKDDIDQLKDYLKTTVCSMAAAIQLLIAEGANINSLDFMGQTALHYAVQTGFPEVIDCLIKCGADYTCKDDGGMAPIHAAARDYNLKLLTHFSEMEKTPPLHTIEAYEVMVAEVLLKGDFVKAESMYYTVIDLRKEKGIVERPQTQLNTIFQLEEPGEYEEVATLKDNPLLMVKCAALIHARIHGISHIFTQRTLQKFISDHDSHSADDHLMSIQASLLNISSSMAQNDGFSLLSFQPVKELIVSHFRIDQSQIVFHVLETGLHTLIECIRMILSLENDYMREELPGCYKIGMYAIYRLYCKVSNEEEDDQVDNHLRDLLDLYKGDLCKQGVVESYLLHDLFKAIFKDYIFEAYSEMTIYDIVSTVLEFDLAVNARDDEGCTPLHYLLIHNQKDELRDRIDIADLENVVNLLLHNGIHIDTISKEGYCIVKLLKRQGYPVCEASQRSLKCLAAEAVMKLNIDFVNEIPKTLVPFTNLHGYTTSNK